MVEVVPHHIDDSEDPKEGTEDVSHCGVPNRPMNECQRVREEEQHQKVDLVQRKPTVLLQQESLLLQRPHQLLHWSNIQERQRLRHRPRQRQRFLHHKGGRNVQLVTQPPSPLLFYPFNKRSSSFRMSYYGSKRCKGAEGVL